MDEDRLLRCGWSGVARVVLTLLLVGLLLAPSLASIAAAGVRPGPAPQDEPDSSQAGETREGAGGLGMVPSGPDKQHLVRMPAGWIPVSELPAAIDLTGSSMLLEGQPSQEGLPPVGHQQWTNTCTGWAASYYYKTYQEWLEHDWDLANGTALRIRKPATKKNPRPNWDLCVITEDATLIPVEDLDLILKQLERWKAWAKSMKVAGRWKETK